MTYFPPHKVFIHISIQPIVYKDCIPFFLGTMHPHSRMYTWYCVRDFWMLSGSDKSLNIDWCSRSFRLHKEEWTITTVQCIRVHNANKLWSRPTFFKVFVMYGSHGLWTCRLKTKFLHANHGQEVWARSCYLCVASMKTIKQWRA